MLDPHADRQDISAHMSVGAQKRADEITRLLNQHVGKLNPNGSDTIPPALKEAIRRIDWKYGFI